VLALGLERYWYWPILAGIGVDQVLGDIFLTVTSDTDYRYPLTPRRPARRCLLSKQQSNSSRRRAAATIQPHLANNSGTESGMG